MDITLYTPRYARREVWRAHERFFLKISIILFLLCLASVEVWGQDRVQLFGVVRDAETKQPIPGATLTVLDSRFVMKTNEWGEYAFESINKDKMEITFSCVGYAPLVYSLRQLKRRRDIHLKKQVSRIEEAIVRHRNPKNVMLDIEQRRHLNLGQMLEGTVPGLIFRPSTTAEQEVIFSTPQLNISGNMNLRQLYEQMKRNMPESMAMYPTFLEFQRVFDQKRSELMREVGANIVNQTKLSSLGLVPEFRGGSALPADTKGMLVLVDGFPEKEFPLNMPMANIESVEVIRDPEEGIKYGPEGVNGVVLIKTMRGSVGKPLEIHYTQNFFISELEDMSNKSLERISSRDLLDLYRDRFDLDITPMTNLHLPYIGVNPAYLLLNHHRHDKISASEFEHRWDSLGNLDNQQQIRQSQQRVGMQNYNLRLAGRKDEVRYNLSLMYSDNKSSTPGDYMRNFDLNSNNSFSFFKNKIEGNLYVRYRLGENKTVPRMSMSLEPYQMLYDEQGNYVYD
ncbi:carboxypeptidase-like regulatory domain-containing protein [Sphingobacterium sp. BN32]|uniref:carboxypeptidase-like regulatory domain-containing protein n=1 Tax=Sphingobacterium sp. BN32 TaxID=3058432 RepID=UPI00265CF2AC|nr:carboxypeptidase-like regulatory domain-containing protein [Sphingobacterium sp. BN32]WKK57113.1 carboxypeptidase-like regulatory domain-containing protein [Sphingobacterium sp. BN32]